MGSVSFSLSQIYAPCSVRTYPVEIRDIATIIVRRRRLFSVRKVLVPISARVVKGSSQDILQIIGISWGTTYIITTAIASTRKNKIITGYVIALVILFLRSSWDLRSLAIARKDSWIIPVCSPLSTIAISCSSKKSGSFRIAIFTASPHSTKKRRWSTHSRSLPEDSRSRSHFSAVIRVTPHSRRLATFS